MTYNLLIIGLGNIGLRHLQSISKINHKFKIFLYDTNIERSTYKKKIEKYKNVNHRIIFSKFEKLNQEYFDVIFICTTAHKRYELLDKIVKTVSFKFMIIEKLLEQNASKLSKIKRIFKNNNNIFVNTPRRTMAVYKNINKLINNKLIYVEITGGNWGLACNFIHYADLIYYWTNKKIKDVHTNHLNKKWHNSKRKDYFEIYGEIKIVFKDNINLTLKCNNSNKERIMKIINGNDKIQYNEKTGIILLNNKIYNNKKINLQSCMTKKIVTNLLFKQTSELPKLNESIDLHMEVINKLKKHWNTYENKKNILPIT